MGRNARLQELTMIGRNGLDRLHLSTVAVLGVGNVGGQLIQHLGLLGIGLILVDYDMVQEENLGTQGFTPDQLGLAKVYARAQTLAQLNPECRVRTLACDVESLGIARFRNVDLILCCLDTRRTRTVVNEIAIRNGIPWVDAAIDGSGQTLMGRVAAYDPRQAQSPCYLCPYDSSSLHQILCEGLNESCPSLRLGLPHQGLTSPTIAFSALGAAAVALQVVWAVKMLLGRGQELVGRELYMDLDRHRLQTHTQRQNPQCVIDHRILSMTPLGDSTTTVEQTFDAAVASLGEGVQLQLHRRTLVTSLQCPQCTAIKRPYKLFDTIKFEDARCSCGGKMEAVPFGCKDQFSRQESLAFVHKSWKELGLPPDDVVTATKGESEIHYLVTHS